MRIVRFANAVDSGGFTKFYTNPNVHFAESMFGNDISNQEIFQLTGLQLINLGVATIAPWFHLRLPSCGPWFESQAHHLHFFQFVLKL